MVHDKLRQVLVANIRPHLGEIESTVRAVTHQPVPQGVLNSAKKYVQKIRGLFAAAIRSKLDAASGLQGINAHTTASAMAAIVSNRQKWASGLNQDVERGHIKEAAVEAASKVLHTKANRALVAAAGEVVSFFFFLHFH